MILSICIPTYNRCAHLTKNIKNLIGLIHQSNRESEVEINISDNGSSDNTFEMVHTIIKENHGILINYRKNNTNMGPDANYIQTMKMAKGKYSILLGDDDYIKDWGLDYIFSLLIKYKDVDVFISNRTEVDEKGAFLQNRFFLRKDVTESVFDFSNELEASYYFSLCRSFGGCLTYISSIIYRTSILDDIGSYDNSLDGTYYSFWYYLWGSLVRGGKLLYTPQSYILCTIPEKNNNFGLGLERSMVEINGFSKGADVLFKDRKCKQDFLDVVKRCFSYYELIRYYCRYKGNREELFIPAVKKIGWEGELCDFLKVTTPKFQLYCLLVNILPEFVLKLLRK